MVVKSISMGLCTLVLFLTMTVLPSRAAAEDPVFLVLRSGVVIALRDGYKSLVEALRRAGGKEKMVEINIEGFSFFINPAEIDVLCKSPCRAMTVRQPGEKEK